MSERRHARYRENPQKRGTKQSVGIATFAAATSPLISPISSKNHKRTCHPEEPLLGVTGQSQSTKKMRLGDSSKAFRSGSPEKMFALPSTGKQRIFGKLQRKSIARFLTKVSLRVKRGKFAELKRPQPDILPSREVRSDDDCECIEAMIYEKCASESSVSPDKVFDLNSTMDYSDTDDSMSLIEQNELNMNTRLTPLSFDDTQVTNHFRISSERDDFSLNKALSPRLNSANISQETDTHVPSVCLDDMLQIADFLPSDFDDSQSLPPDDNISHFEAHVHGGSQNSSKEDVNRREFNEILDLIIRSRRCSLAHSSSEESHVVDLPEIPQMGGTEGQDNLMNGDQMRRSNSSESIPSLSGDADDLDRCTPTNNIIPDPTSTNDAADSAIAWGCLAALLGSPAPISARKQKKRLPANLWQDETSPDDDIDAICLLQDDFEVVNEMGTLNLIADDDDDLSIPFSEDPMPDVGDSVDMDVPTTPVRVKPKNIADSTLAWGVLGAFLGSPAPRSVSKKSATKKECHIWNDCEEDVPPEIEGQYEDEDDCDVLCAPIDLTELVDGDEEDSILAGPSTELQDGYKGEESAESVLAWTALGMLLGSPAPMSVCKKSSRKKSYVVAKNLWKDFESIGDEALDSVPFISPDQEDYSLNTERHPSPFSITPSLSGTSDDEDGDSL
jgi:hypothetical protein